MDGGIKLENIETVAKAGANVLVAGSSAFGAADMKSSITAMREA